MRLPTKTYNLALDEFNMQKEPGEVVHSPLQQQLYCNLEKQKRLMSDLMSERTAQATTTGAMSLKSDLNSPLDLSVVKPDVQDRYSCFTAMQSDIQNRGQIPFVMQSSAQSRHSGNSPDTTTNLHNTNEHQSTNASIGVSFVPTSSTLISGIPSMMTQAMIPMNKGNIMYFYPVGIPGISKEEVQVAPSVDKSYSPPSVIPTPVAPPEDNGYKVVPGKMKVLTENNIYPGVYTSILKLPWSRRKRTKYGRRKQNPQQTAPQSQDLGPGPGLVNPIHQPPQITSNSGALPCQNSEIVVSQSPSMQSATTVQQSVMMVYHQASMSPGNNGKVVRRRGRPPKLPVLAQLLAAERRSMMQSRILDTNVENKIEKMNTDDNAFNKTVPLCTVAESSEMLMPRAFVSAPETSVCDTVIPKVKMESGEVASTVADKQTTFSVTGKTSGAIYQEMYLSSKRLVNIKPRRRQTATEKLSLGSDNFICTSFRIRPRKSRFGSLGKVLNSEINATVVDEKRETDNACVTDANLSNEVVDDPDSLDSKTMFNDLYHCKVCNDVVPEASKSIHQRKHVPFTFFCSICGVESQIFLDNDNAIDDRRVECLQCEKCYEQINMEGFDTKGVSQVSNDDTTCSICGEHFENLSSLYEHKAGEHGYRYGDDPESKYLCDLCEKTFFTAGAFRNHRRSHLEETLSQSIDTCKTSTATKPMVNNGSEERTGDYACFYDGCQKTFIKNSHLQEHIRVKHFNIREYHCSWPGCEKEFAAERHLKIHLLIHKDEKPLTCEYCPYRCRQRNALNWHMRKHPEAPYNYNRKFSMMSTDK